MGYVKLSDFLVLHDVLFVPPFPSNLPSFSAFTLSHNCTINFLFDSCVIQDLTLGLMIRKGRRQENLYFLELGIAHCNLISSSSVMRKSDIWHFRLGHPSAVKIQLLHNELQIPSSLSTLSSHYQIFHLAKQRRIPFISNNHMSTNPLELVHIDVWGPYHVST